MTTQAGGVPGIDVAEAASRLATDDPHGALLVDVREDDELAVVRVADATHVPTSTFVHGSGTLAPVTCAATAATRAMTSRMAVQTAEPG